jgi:hypothetical protein
LVESANNGAGRGRSALIMAPLLGGLVIVAAVGARMVLAEIPDPSAQEAADVTCWDGATRPETECGIPSGRAGLRWMFPSFKPSDLGCRNALLERPRSSRPTMFDCRGRVAVGTVTITYSELTSSDRGRAYLEKEYGFEPEELDDHLGRRLLWTEGDKAGDDIYELAMIYADLPFGVEVRARSAEARDRALQSLVRFRAESHASVRPFD